MLGQVSLPFSGFSFECSGTQASTLHPLDEGRPFVVKSHQTLQKARVKKGYHEGGVSRFFAEGALGRRSGKVSCLRKVEGCPVQDIMTSIQKCSAPEAWQRPRKSLDPEK